MKKALEVQEGGSHYKKYKIQPYEYVHKNNLSFGQGCVVKYITRYKDKNGLEDLKKIIHNVKIIAKFDYDVEL